MRFLDTNILLYAISKAADERTKSEIALKVLEEKDLALSVQVLQEFYVQATRSAKKDRISHDQAVLLIESWLRFSVQENTVELMHASFKASHRFHLSYWDAAIVEAARSLRCRILLSEDMSHGRDYGGVRVMNPFL